MYEIKFVENTENFYQLGKLYTYEVRCERFEYSSEKIDTDFASIDAIEDTYSLATDTFDELLDEDGFKLLFEDAGTILEESDIILQRDPKSDNDFIDKKIIDDDIIDFSEKNPFADSRVY
jgi:hypothetical protein